MSGPAVTPAGSWPDPAAAPVVLDHVLIVVHHLQKAMDDYAALGFRARRTPAAAGTEAAVVELADGTSLRLQAWLRPAPDDSAWRRLDRCGEGIAGYALAPQRAMPASPTAHANGAIGIESLAIAVRDVAAELTRFRTLAPVGAAGAHVGLAIALPVTGTRIGMVELGDNTLVLMAPGVGTGPLPGEHPLALRLASAGEGPYALVLRTREAVPWTLDLGLSHGAAIELVPAPQPTGPSGPRSLAAMVGG